MSRQRHSVLPLLLVALMLFSSTLPLANAALSNWAGPSVVQVPTPNGGTILVDGFEIPRNDTVLDAWLEVSEDGMRDIGAGTEWVADKPGGLNFSFGQTINTTTHHFGRELSLTANHSVGRIDDFETLQRDLGIARNLLTDRLHHLAELGIVDRVPYQDRPVRHEYILTAKGADLSPALVALMRWGDRWYAESGPPTLLVHDACGTPLDQAVSCPECHEPVAPHHIRSRPGPGRTTEETPW